MSYENLLVEKSEQLAVVTIHRPKVLNALNAKTIEELDACFRSLQHDSEVRAVILTGAGEKAFIAGADINEMADASAIDMLLRDAISGWDRLRRIKAEIEATALGRSMPADDYVFSIPAVPQDAYVNFRLTFWDLETTNLTAIMGRILVCAFADEFGQTKALRYEDYPGKSVIDDGPLGTAIRDELEKSDVWVTWNGKLFDVPLLNSRLLKAGERPLRSDVKHIDLMYYAGGQFNRIGSRKMENVSKFVNSPNRKTPLDWETWQMAAVGDRAAMDSVVEHGLADVLVTRDLFASLKPAIRIVHR